MLDSSVQFNVQNLTLSNLSILLDSVISIVVLMAGIGPRPKTGLVTTFSYTLSYLCLKYVGLFQISQHHSYNLFTIASSYQTESYSNATKKVLTLDMLKL